MQLSPQRTFVIQLVASAQLLGGRAAGCIEHVVSHQAANFGFLDTLLAFMTEVLREVDETPPERETGLRVNV